uniref:HDC14862 n=1 Tax=Drosophila melanogaster TaxID=7227 RepID=Q6IJI2_DROME|nr:TPA_inf: HDC14862 [Drosophila melanogaster]
MLIARLAFLVSILGIVVGFQKLDSTSSPTTTSTMRSAPYCQPSGGYCKSHADCCSTMCLTQLGQCSPKRGDQCKHVGSCKWQAGSSWMQVGLVFSHRLHFPRCTASFGSAQWEMAEGFGC